MNMLQQGFPTAQMMVCGVLGPKSNAHGPNEFLHVPYAQEADGRGRAGDGGVPLSRIRHPACRCRGRLAVTASAISMPSTAADMMPPA